MSTGRVGQERRSHGLLWLLAGIAAVVVLCLLSILVDSALYYNKVHRGISVSGVALGGMTKAEAAAAVGQIVDEASSKNITLTSGDKTWTVEPAGVGRSVDADGVVKAAMAVTRDRNFFTDAWHRWGLYFAHREVPLTGSLDTAKLDAVVAGIAKTLDVPAVNAALSITGGTIQVIESKAGTVVDQARLKDEVSGKLLALQQAEIQVPLVAKQPDVTAEDNAEAKQQAETMISGMLLVTDGSDDWPVTPEQIATYMNFRAETKNGVSTLVPYLDAAKMTALMNEVAAAVREEPTEPNFAHDDEKVWVEDGEEGTQLDAEATAATMTAAALKSKNRTAKVATKALPPTVSSENLKAMGIKELLTSYTTRYPCEIDRQINVRKATEYATNVFLAPGQEYDFDKQVGPRTPERGFRMAKGITSPGVLEDVLGGGICQVSTTMFIAVASGKAGLDIKERHNHSFYISHYPKGKDATVTGGGKNLRFVNDTKNYIWITGESNGAVTTIQVWGTDQGRETDWDITDFYDIVPLETTTVTDPTLKYGASSLVASGQRGQKLKTTRVVVENGVEIHKDVWTSIWTMFPDKIAVATSTTKAPTTTTTEKPTTTSSAG